MVATQELGGAVGTWQIDNSHSSVDFAVKHMVVATTRGTFRSVEGTLMMDERNPSASSVQVSIDAASIDSRDEKRDAHLRSGDFLDAERFPTIEFRSRRVEPLGGERYRVVGELTVRGVTREVAFDFAYLGQMPDPWGGIRAGFEAELSIDRREFGLSWNAALEAGGVLVGDAVKITLHVEAVRPR